MSVEGLDEVAGRLELLLNDIAGPRTEACVTDMILTGGSHAAMITPIDTGDLLASQGHQVTQTETSTNGVIYYGAAYAGWVHRMSGRLKGQPRAHFGKTSEGVEFGGGTGRGNYWDPNGEPQFLLKGMEQMVAEDKDEIIQRHYSL